MKQTVTFFSEGSGGIDMIKLSAIKNLSIEVMATQISDEDILHIKDTSVRFLEYNNIPTVLSPSGGNSNLELEPSKYKDLKPSSLTNTTLSNGKLNGRIKVFVAANILMPHNAFYLELISNPDPPMIPNNDIVSSLTFCNTNGKFVALACSHIETVSKDSEILSNRSSMTTSCSIDDLSIERSCQHRTNESMVYVTFLSSCENISFHVYDKTTGLGEHLLNFTNISTFSNITANLSAVGNVDAAVLSSFLLYKILGKQIGPYDGISNTTRHTYGVKLALPKSNRMELSLNFIIPSKYDFLYFDEQIIGQHLNSSSANVSTQSSLNFNHSFVDNGCQFCVIKVLQSQQVCDVSLKYAAIEIDFWSNCSVIDKMITVDMSSFEGLAKKVSYIDEQDVTVYRYGNGYGKVNSFINISYFDARRIGIFLDSSRNLSYHETFQEFMTGNNMLLSAAVNASRLSIVENTCIDENIKSTLHELHKNPPRVDVTSLVLGDNQLTSQTIAYVPRQSAFNKSLPPASLRSTGSFEQRLY